jgi:PAS domain S-box-containing protein
MSTPLVSDKQALRQLAEHQMENRTGMHTAQAYAALPPDAQLALLHELQVHQIELELQNDELRRTQVALDTAQARYFDFYDLAPVGYVTVNDKALILQANLTLAALLGVHRSTLVGKALPGFMPAPDADRYYLLCQQALASASTQSCDLQMRQASGTTVWVNLQAIAVPGDHGTTVIRIVMSDITARKRLEESVVRSEADTKAILDGASDAIFITDAAGRYQYVNRQATQLLGFSRDQLLGMGFPDITTENDLAATQVLFQQLIETGSLRYETLMKHGNGGTVAVELNCRMLSDGRAFGACRDISERKQAEALRLASNKYRDTILDSVPSQIAVLDPTGTIVAVNQAWRKFALANSAVPGEMSSKTQIGTNYLDICSAAQGGEPAECAALARDGILSVIHAGVPVFRLEYPCDMPTGQLWFAMAVTPLNVENPGVVVTHTDITEQRQLRDHLLAIAVETEMAASRQQLRDLVAFNATAIEAERKHIARDVHDELGQVLTALRMDMSLLNMQFGALDPALPGKVEGMKALVDRAMQGVRDVATRLRPMALDMGLATAIEAQCAEFAARTAIACTFSAQQDLMAMDETRAVEVYRIVQESLTNISRYAQASQVQVSLGYSGNTLGVEVHDNGRGFLAADAQQAKTFGLLGMRERAMALGGHLDVISVPGQGTVVGLTIPIHKDTTGGPT